jgi:hypothetical protein
MNVTDARWALFKAIADVVDSGRMPDDDGGPLSAAVEQYGEAVKLWAVINYGVLSK